MVIPGSCWEILVSEKLLISGKAVIKKVYMEEVQCLITPPNLASDIFLKNALGHDEL